MTTQETQEALVALGWPIDVDGSFGPQTFEAVLDFQRAHAFWDLVADGLVGPKTEEALVHALENGCRCSTNFKYNEFTSKGNGWIRVSRELVRGLELYRELVGGPVSVVSAHRDTIHNRKVGGAKSSQHLHGNAVDLDPAKDANAVKGLQWFSGIGIQKASGLVRHVDVRHVGPNTTGGSPSRPTIWFYP
jgi:peptidoglycan hydrolase-like protein with peptidoglycan-binding domain